MNEPQPAESARMVRTRIRETGHGFAYHLFLSHVRTPDKELAWGLRTRLQQIGRRWWELRQMRVYLDVVSGPAGPSLSQLIDNGLRNSAGLVLLACEQSRQSRWVNEEVRTWWELEREPPIIVLTDGEIVWDYDANDFDWTQTTALNEDLFRGRYSAVPVWMDLRPAQRTPRRLSEAAVAIAGALLRIKPEVLAGHERRRRRRHWALALSAAVLVSVLTATSVWYADAARQAREAEQLQARRKLAEQLASAAHSSDVSLDQSLLLSAAAYRIAPREQAQALWSVAALHSGLHRIARMPAGAGVGTVDSVVFSPDGRWLAGASSVGDLSRRSAAVIVWPGSGESAGVVVTYGSKALAAKALAVSPDGRTLAVGDSSGSVSLLAVPQTGPWQPQATTEFGPGPAEVERLSFDTDGTRLAVSHTDGTTRIWQLGQDRPVASFSGGRSVFDPRGRTIASIEDASRVVIRDAQTLAVKTSGQVPGAADVAFGEDGRRVAIAAASGSTGVWLAEVATGKLEPIPNTPFSTLVAFSDIDTIATDAGTVVIDAGGGPPVVTWRPAAMMMARSVAFSTGQAMYAVAGHWLDPTLAGGVMLRRVEATAYQPLKAQGLAAAVTPDGTVVRSSLATGQPTGPQPAAGVSAPTALAESRDRTLLTGVNGRQVSVWKTADGSVRTTFLPVPDVPGAADGRTMSGLGLSPDNRRLAVTGPDSRVSVITLSGAGLEVETVLTPDGVPTDLAFSPDGQLLAIATQRGVEVWQVPAPVSAWRRVELSPANPADFTEAAAIAFAGARSLIVTDGRRLARWELAEGRVQPLPGLGEASRPIVRMAVNPQNTLLAGLTTGGAILLWDLESGQRLATALTAPPPVISMSFTEDGATLITSGAALSAWNLDPRNIVEWICDVVRRDLDAQEWQQYGTGAQPDVCPMWP